MRYFFSLFALNISLLLPILPVHATEPSDFYADAVASASTATVYQPSNALGAPDGAYADFQDSLASVTLDMGEEEEGTGDITLHYQILENGALYAVELLDADMNVLLSASDTFDIGTTELTIPYAGETPYRYVKVVCAEDELWRLDAVSATSVVEAIVEEPAPIVSEEPSTETQADPQDTATVPQGLLVKLVDDGDPNTTVDEAVYVIGADGMRHAFPSETIYKSWFKDFEDVAYIDPENLAAYQLGKNVTVRPGTWLVKITTDPKVYAVESSGVLRWVTTEEIATSLFGTNWADRVIDVPDVSWNNYTVGDPITTEVHPSGTVGVTTVGEVRYFDATAAYTLPSGVAEYMRFSADFYVRMNDERYERYDEGGELSEEPNIAFPF